jgi:hypothetical protein
VDQSLQVCSGNLALQRKRGEEGTDFSGLEVAAEECRERRLEEEACFEGVLKLALPLVYFRAWTGMIQCLTTGESTRFCDAFVLLYKPDAADLEPVH